MVFFPRKKTRATNNLEAPSFTAIQYKKGLTTSLTHDHKALKSYYASLHKAHSNNDYEELSNQLYQFRMMLQAHINKENVQFYVYLENMLANQPQALETIKTLRREMNNIVSKVVGFAKQYENIATSDSLQKNFKKDLETVFSLLDIRIEKEETQLYALYQPQQKAI